MSTVLRFDRFEFHPESGELLANGERRRLEMQPAKVLLLLASRAGEVVTREELQRELWPADTFVDFEHGINYCIRRVRAALGDSATESRFVETLPKRGYRFLPEVKTLDLGEAAARPSKVRRAGRGLAALAIGLALVAAVVLAMLVSHSASPPPTIAVTLFDNETGRPELNRTAQVFTDVLVERLARDNRQWTIIGNASVLRTQRPFLNLERIATSLHADYIVLGQLEPREPGLTVLLHFIRARDQRHLWVGRLESASLSDPSLPARVAEQVAAAGRRLLRSGS